MPRALRRADRGSITELEPTDTRYTVQLLVDSHAAGGRPTQTNERRKQRDT
jgi:hypothetical protein